MDWRVLNLLLFLSLSELLLQDLARLPCPSSQNVIGISVQFEVENDLQGYSEVV